MVLKTVPTFEDVKSWVDDQVSTAATSLSELDDAVDSNDTDISNLQSNKLDSSNYTPVSDVNGSTLSNGLTIGGDLTDGSSNVIYDESNNYINQSRLQNDSVTIEGNSVSLGGSTTVNHNDLSSISSDDHHTKTDSASELTDVSADSVSDAHHAKYTDSNAVSAINAEIDNAATSVSSLDDTVADKLDSSSYTPISDVNNNIFNAAFTISGLDDAVAGKASDSHDHSSETINPDTVDVSTQFELPTASEGDTAPNANAVAIDPNNGVLLIAEEQ